MLKLWSACLAPTKTWLSLNEHSLVLPSDHRTTYASNANVTQGSLCCENADEAKTLIPSLADKIKDEDLQDLLDEISKLQNR